MCYIHKSTSHRNLTCPYLLWWSWAINYGVFTAQGTGTCGKHDVVKCNKNIKQLRILIVVRCSIFIFKPFVCKLSPRWVYSSEFWPNMVQNIFIFIFYKVEGIRASCQMAWAWSRWPPGLTDICFKYLRSSGEFCQLLTWEMSRGTLCQIGVRWVRGLTWNND